jgi:hypothetical protein
MGIKKGGGIMKEYTSEIKLYFVGNNREANSVEEYKQLIIDQYQEEFGIENESEIKNIKEWSVE